jgi:lipopolysaccharide/colanic/teichoic acid biosynthesis glycosyltransferase
LMPRLIKRALDVGVSLFLLMLMSPVAVLCAIAIYLRMGPPILFRQSRPGRDERPFQLYKFRTMREVDQPGRRVSDRDRVTQVGRTLRRTSLDELPTLWNVLRGDMSLVGPRPLLLRYLPYFTEEERLRFTVRPGITGLAQIRGRNLLAWSDRLASDIEYVERWSLRLDVKIIGRTVGQVLRGEGVLDDVNLVMDDFDTERAKRGSDSP